MRILSRTSRNVLLLVVLLIALAMLSNVSQALQRHEPSARIFRALLEFQLIVAGAACSLYLWEQTMGKKWIDRLFFLLNDPINNNNYNYNYSDMNDRDDDDNNNNNDDTHFAPFVDENTLKQLQNEETKDMLSQHSSDECIEMNESTSTVPTATHVFRILLDNLLTILFVLFLFSWNGWNDPSIQWIAWIAAPTFPLLLFAYYSCYCTFIMMQPRSFWNVLACCTVLVPFQKVTFRDGFVGDVLTSSVRPMQDIIFTLVYLLYGLQGWWSSQSYDSALRDEDEDDESLIRIEQLQDTLDPTILLPALEKSWILHTILLPACVIGPLWWRFLQNLRQVKDEKRRWPYLGNAFKYFLAAQVAVTGVYLPEWQQSPVWLTAFVVATLYQIYWDVFMDWGLLEWSGQQWKLRAVRLYRNRALYWSIAGINVVLRFGWTLTFIPTRYLNAAGVLIQQNKLIMSPLLASAEIVRRTLWGWLRFEYEVLKLQKEEEGVPEGEETPDSFELVPMKKMDTLESIRPTMADNSRVHAWNDMSSLNDTQILLELCVYAVTFATLWIIAIAHRSTQ